MTIPPDLNVYISAALFIFGAYMFALYVGMVVWTFRDIHSRSRDMLAQIMATLLVALFTVPGLLIYMLLRPHHTLAEEYERSLTEEAILHELDEQRVCLSCHRRVEPDFIVCPYCHEQLRLRCVGCGRLLNPDWDVCPYCGLFRDQGEKTVEQAPAATVVAKTAGEESLLAGEPTRPLAMAMPGLEDATVTGETPAQEDPFAESTEEAEE